MADPGLILYQAEWCPFSAAVREALTELGIDYTIRQVEPYREGRDELRAVAGTDEIPVLRLEDGRFLRGWREILRHLRERRPWQYAAAHRRQYVEHADARETDVAGRVIKVFHGESELRSIVEGELSEPVVRDAPDESRYELRLDGKLIGLAAYRRRPGRIVFTHTEVDESCEGRGYGSRLARTALDAAREQGLEVLPLCPFMAGYIERHPEYRELLVPGYRGAA